MTQRYLSHKANQFQESVIREMTRICLQVKGVNLAQGFPDHDPEQIFKDAAKEAIDQGFNQYAITWGAPQFRQAIARKVSEYNKIPTDSEKNITVTCGATEAMLCALMAVTNPGDEVIVFEPFYENYGPDCILSGAKPVFVSLNPEGEEFIFNPKELEQAFTNKTKALILNTPSNPLGKVFNREELEFISQLCQKHDVLAITDEIYEHFLYDNTQHISIGSLPGMQNRTITIGGCSKTYSVTGWRLAYMIASEEITSGLRKVHDFLTVGAPHPLQVAAATMLTQNEDFYERLQNDFDKRRHLLFDILQEAGFRCYKPKGAYYILTDIKHFLGKELTNDQEFALWLTREIGVATVPGSSFYEKSKIGRHQIRFTFSKKPATLERAGELLKGFSDRLPK